MEMKGMERLYMQIIGTWHWHQSGHTGEVFAARFDPSGAHLASGSMDSKICAYIYVFFLKPLCLTDSSSWSALGYRWRMPQLWHPFRPQRRHYGPLLVPRRAGAIYSLDGCHCSELGHFHGSTYPASWRPSGSGKQLMRLPAWSGIPCHWVRWWLDFNVGPASEVRNRLCTHRVPDNCRCFGWGR